MSKILFVSNIAKRINSFSSSSIAAAKHQGMEFHHAANWNSVSQEQIEADEREYGIKIHSIDLDRSPFSKKNIKAYRQMKDLIRSENIDYIHCNTPVGGLLGRLAGKKCKVKKVIYQVHGFHFYQGAPKKNWLIYYPIEKWLAHRTDALITINQEDYALAKEKIKLRNGGKVYFVHGVGIDLKQYESVVVNYEEKRKDLGIPTDAFVMISGGELNVNKNNTVILSAMAKLGRKDIHYVLCGVGDQRERLEQQAREAGILEQVHFLGFRTDMKELYRIADCFVMPSFREGLSRAIMEAMANGLPCIVSDIRGNRDLVKQDLGGYLCHPSDTDAFEASILKIVDDPNRRNAMKSYNLEAIREYDVSVVEREIVEIYQDVFEG